MAGLPFAATVYTKGYVRRGPLGAVSSMSGEVVHNGAGSLEFTVPSDHPRMTDLATPGARVVLRYRPDPSVDLFMLSGRVEEVAGGGSRFVPWRRFRVVDDFTVLTDEVQLWPNPTGTITQQGADTAYFVRSGPAETVLKALLAPNVARQGTVLTIPASQGLGATVRVRARFHTVPDVMPDLTALGIGVRVRQDGATRVLDVSVPPVVAQTLTQASGVVVDGEYDVSAPTVTRVAIGAGGEGTARLFRQKVDTAREAAYGVVLPVFRDARDVKEDTDTTAADVEAILIERMNETLAEGAPTASLKAVLAETGWFRLGRAYVPGSRVKVQLAGGPVIEDHVRRVAFSWTPDRGVTLTPIVGDWTDVADERLFKHVRALTRAVGQLERR
jgi:hypothetical protein